MYSMYWSGMEVFLIQLAFFDFDKENQPTNQSLVAASGSRMVVQFSLFSLSLPMLMSRIIVYSYRIQSRCSVLTQFQRVKSERRKGHCYSLYFELSISVLCSECISCLLPSPTSKEVLSNHTTSIICFKFSWPISTRLIQPHIELFLSKKAISLSYRAAYFTIFSGFKIIWEFSI